MPLFKIPKNNITKSYARKAVKRLQMDMDKSIWIRTKQNTVVDM